MAGWVFQKFFNVEILKLKVIKNNTPKINGASATLLDHFRPLPRWVHTSDDIQGVALDAGYPAVRRNHVQSVLVLELCPICGGGGGMRFPIILEM